MKKIKRLPLRALFSVGLFLLGVGFFLSSYSKFQLTRDMETLFAVFRDAMLLNVDEPDPKSLSSAGINGMLRTLDPYAAFIPQEDMNTLQFMATGGYAGIGALIQSAGEYTLIASIYEGTPSHRHGLRVGDTIVALNGESVKGWRTEQVSNKLKGKAGSTLTVTVRRPHVEGEQTVKIKRDNIHIPSVGLAQRLQNDVAYVNLSTFTTGCSGDVFTAIDTMSKATQSLRGVILDLRGNVGGLLEEAVKIVSLFIQPGQTVVEVRGRVLQGETVSRTEGSAPFSHLPLVVLVDRSSASSSEVVAGALQDLDRAIVIGERTFGKGLVQSTRALPYSGTIKLTTAKYYTPSGRCIQALDYAHRDKSGAVGRIPDSLVSSFKTLNGRTVYDGGGVWPDFPIRSEQYNLFVTALYVEQAFFRYATLYERQHPLLPSPTQFALTEQDMAAFLEFLVENGYREQTPIIGLVDQLKELAQSEEQSEILMPYLDSAKAALSKSFSFYYEKFSPSIAQLLEEEIVSRYYFQEGRLAKRLTHDSLIEKSLELIRNPSEMQRILREVSPPDAREQTVAENEERELSPPTEYL